MYKKMLLASLVVGSALLSGCVVSPSSYSNVELVQCAQRGEVFMREDSFGLCAEELASRVKAGKVSKNDMLIGGMGTAASIASDSDASNVMSASIIANGG